MAENPHDDAAGRVGGDQFVFDGAQHTADQLERMGITDQLKDDENIGEQYNQMAEWGFPVEVDQHKGEDGDKIDESIEGEKITQTGPERRSFGISGGGGDQTQQVFDQEDERSQMGDRIEDRSARVGLFIRG